MSAIIIYPAAFRNEAAPTIDGANRPSQEAGTMRRPWDGHQPTVTHGKALVPQAARVIPLAPPPCDSISAEKGKGLVQTVRVSASRSARSLASAQDHMNAVTSSNTQMAQQAEEVARVSDDLGAQMQRLIAETRRMVAYLRSDSL